MGTCTGCTPVAVNVAGFVPFAIFQQEDGSIGYEMEVITHVNSDIQALDDIAGRRVAFTHPSSNSGYISARILIKQETGLDDEAGDYIAEFSGSHQNSILGVFNEDYDAAPIANDVLNRMCLNEQVDL
jgi:phosphonate transport system substrate-binding protein